MSTTVKDKKRVTFKSSDSDKEGETKNAESTENASPNCSSSDSDIENYLQPPDQLDLNSSFFNTTTNSSKIGELHLEDIISDCESDLEDEVFTNAETDHKENKHKKKNKDLKHLELFARDLQQVKQKVKEYTLKEKARRAKQTKTADKNEILDLLAVGESKSFTNQTPTDLDDSMEFESFSESEQDDWEEVEGQEASQVQANLVSKDGVQITVELPGVMRKKKGVDLIASMKRRLNRIKKQNQAFIHKVHLLCWLAHGNFVNDTLNNKKLLGLALSLLPPQFCIPPKTLSANNLEEIVKWYAKTMKNADKIVQECLSLPQAIHLQMNRLKVYNKKMFVYVFICILRSLGITCRLVLSFQVEPFTPPSEELCSTSAKVSKEKDKEKRKKASLNTTSDAGKIEQDVEEGLEEPGKNSLGKKSEIKTDNVCKESQTLEAMKSVKLENSPNTKSFVSYSPRKALRSKTLKESPKSKRQPRKTRPRSFTSSAVEAEPRKKKDVDEKTREVRTLRPRKSAIRTNDHTIASDKNQELFEEVAKPKKQEVLLIKLPIKTKSTSEINHPANAKVSKLSTRKSTAKADCSSITVKEIPSKIARCSSRKIPQLDGMNDSDNDASPLVKPPKSNTQKLKQTKKESLAKLHSKRLKSLPNYREIDSDEDFLPRSPFAKKNNVTTTNFLNKKEATKVSVKLTKLPDDVPLPKNNDTTTESQKEIKVTGKKTVKQDHKRRTMSEEPPKYIKEQDNSDDDFKENVKSPVKLKKNSRCGKRSIDTKKKGMDIWVEVFIEGEEEWISVDVVKGQVQCVSGLYSRASHPVTYVVAWNNDNSVKDVTKRYCPEYNTVTRKLRVEPRWWLTTLAPFVSTKTAQDKKEDEYIERLMLEKPLPTTISEYKNHPLYVLRRHLLKFEAIYPTDAVTLGFVRKEPVYSRDCVYTLLSREKWIRQALVVKPGEKPYKIVQTTKYDRLSGLFYREPLEIFGKWQVADYVPPTAENGIVPRNEYGNVELFKLCMLPKKTVHLQLPGLNKVARKMNIDCASAITGFNFHSGWFHPNYDGYVVCEEFADVLEAVWHIEQDELDRKEDEKIEKRVYGNWKRLVKGVLIRERLKARYDFGDLPDSQQGGHSKRKLKGPKLSTKKHKMCSD